MFIFSVSIIVIFLIIVFASYQTVHYFLKDGSDKHPLVVFTATTSLIVAFACCAMPPFDLYVATHLAVSDKSTASGTVKQLYYAIFATISGYIGVITPFTIFFYRQNQDEGACCQRFMRAMKRTAMFAAVMVTAFLLGLAFRPGHTKWSKESDTQHWASKLFDTEHAGSSAMLFVVGVLSSVGVCAWMTFTAYGLAVVPLNLVRGYRSLEEERLEIETKLLKIKSRERTLEMKRKSSSYTSEYEKASAIKLKRKSHALKRHTQALQDLQDMHTFGNGYSAMQGCSKRTKIVLGIFLFCVSILMTSALLLSANDTGLSSDVGAGDLKAMGHTASGGGKASKQSTKGGTSGKGHVPKACVDDPNGILCAINTGYLGTLVHKKRMYNPLDDLLVDLARSFPLDLFLLGVCLIYLAVASFVGLTRMGIRCLCCSVYSYRKKQSTATAVLVLSAMFMFISLAIIVQLGSIAPQYTTFGPQHFRDDMAAPGAKGKVQEKRCTLENDFEGIVLNEKGVEVGKGTKHCTMSQIALLLIQMVKTYPIFSHIFFASSWMFALTFVVAATCNGVCGKKSPNFLTSDFEDDEDIGIIVKSNGDVRTTRRVNGKPGKYVFGSSDDDTDTDFGDETHAGRDRIIKNSIGRNQTDDGFDTRRLNTSSFDHNSRSNYTDGYRGGAGYTKQFKQYRDEPSDDSGDDIENGGGDDYGDEEWGANYD
eukprot:g9569.t1